MKKIVGYIFPGQGAQYVGMGKEMYDKFNIARSIFDTANRILGFDITRLCFQGPAEELKATINCQPAIFVMNIACFEVFRHSSRSKDFFPRFMAGLSLGEYSALVAAGVLDFKAGVKLVRRRAELMEEQAGKNPGKMAAIMGLDKERVQVICGKAGTDIANLNCPGQIVISGRDYSIDLALELANGQGAKTVLLEVSGAFHSFLMKDATDKLEELLYPVKFRKKFNSRVISNVRAEPQYSIFEIRENLINQIYSPVLWEDTVRYMIDDGISDFLEIGPNKVLKGMIRRIDPNLQVYNIEKPQDIEDLPV